MMCAVISRPFWAGWLNKITAHTPASNNLKDQYSTIDKIDFYLFWDDPLVESFVK